MPQESRNQASVPRALPTCTPFAGTATAIMIACSTERWVALLYTPASVVRQGKSLRRPGIG